MKRKTTLALTMVVVALAGCSKPGEQVPDYHTMIVTTSFSEETDPNYAALKAAQLKCEEAGTGLSATSDPWCVAVQKAQMCGASTPGNQPHQTGPQWATYVQQHAVDGCPAQ